MSARNYNNVAFMGDSSSSGDDEDDNQSSERHSIASDYHFVPHVEKPKSWDKFIQTEDEAKSASEKNTDLIRKGAIALKIITSFIVFFAVLAGGVVAKGALFFMVAQTRIKEEEKYCTPANGTDETEQILVKYEYDNVVAWLWGIFFAFLVPEMLSFLRSARFFMMRTPGKPTWDAFLTVFAFESIHVLGVSLLYYVAFPELDSITALMATNCVAVLPSFLRMFQSPKEDDFGKDWHKKVFLGLSIAAFAIQIMGLFIWPIVLDFSHSWALPLGMFFASFGYWESFVRKGSGPLGKVNQYLYSVRKDMFEKETRYFVYFFISLWKMLLFFLLLIIFTDAFVLVKSPVEGQSAVDYLFSQFSSSFDNSVYHLYYVDLETNVNVTLDDFVDGSVSNLASDVVAAQVICAWAAYIFAKFACKTSIQRVSFALPLTLVMPITISGIIAMCSIRNDDACRYTYIPFTFFNCPDMKELFGSSFGWQWFLFLASQFWVAFHVWFPKSQRLALTEQLFGTPYYSGLLTDQSLLFNRRSDSGKINFRRADQKKKLLASEMSKMSFRRDSSSRRADEVFEVQDGDEELAEQHQVEDGSKKRKKQQMSRPANLAKEEVSRVYGCATMWHESSDEIAEMMKSIFRIDEDYSARFLAKKMLQVNDPDYYEWETHIFFDDCMEPDDSGYEMVVNQFVELLVEQVDVQGKKWYGLRNMKVPYPVKYPTPYGGRLIWTLPGGTKIICHLKDKNKIRHKKRWSQCMYMYYFLGYMLADNDQLSEAQKELRAQNTYLLALDGDVDFQPDAIIKLIDLMKRNPGVGASCGRIHPIGSGYMQWYQMFEYAIGHWLQKATEHVMGCVLCSPGCFAMFRGKAVMDDNVMKTYTTVATEPKHFIQYDQGEDRWLCTLLLQQGWRVEYCAASDSFTACPEGFKEFYNQRRRWMPSTIANIMDLLSDYRRVMRNNDDISIFYIAYQVMLMVGTILGPGSIFLMLIGACAIAFSMTNWLAMVLNLIPMLIFIIVCLTCKSDTQIILAQILSVGYALLMMAVLVGLLIQMTEDGWLAPTTLMFCFVALAFIVSAILHPQEFWCLPMGLIYYLTIPSMYLFLVIYSVFNLNVVSWGTREVAQKKTAEEMEKEREEAEKEAKEPPKKKTGIASWFQRDRFLEFSISNMFHDKGGVKGYLEGMNERLEGIEMALKKEGYTIPQKPAKVVEQEKPKKQVTISVTKAAPPPREKRDELRNPFWIESDKLGDGPKKYLSRKETNFWFELIEKYLKPLDKDANKEKQIANGLLELRNQVVFSFLMINSIWVVTVFLMQENKDLLYIEWPWGPKGPNMTYEAGSGSGGFAVTLEYEYLQLEPIGLIFVIFFAVVLLIQVIGMLMHRIMTLGHVVATTKIRMTMKKMRGKENKFDENKYLQKYGVDFVKTIQRQYQPEGGNNDANTNMEGAVEEMLSGLTSEDKEEQLRRASTLSLGRRGETMLARKETVNALRRRYTIHEKRKATMKQKPQQRPQPTIKEEEDESSSSNDDENDGANNSNNKRKGEPQKQAIVRTDTYKDPDGIEEREV